MGGFGGFIRDILTEDELFGDEHSRRHDRSTLNQSGIIIYVDPTITENFFSLECHLTVCRISVGSKNVSCSWKREGRNQYMSIVDCVQFCHTEKLIDTLHTMLNVWVVSTNDFRGMWKNYLSIK